MLKVNANGFFGQDGVKLNNMLVDFESKYPGNQRFSYGHKEYFASTAKPRENLWAEVL